MTGVVVAPAMVAGAGGVAIGMAWWTARPMLTARALSLIALAVAMPITAVAAFAVGGFVAGWPLIESVLSACGITSPSHRIGPLEGTAGLAYLTVSGIRLAHLRRRWREAVAFADGRRLHVVDDERCIAFAAPGRPGCVVISRGLLDQLGPAERKVVLAHERAHLRFSHHRHVLAGEVASALVPPLAPLSARIRMATERSADESAVEVVGGDRRLVARTIAVVALHQTAPGGLLPAFGGSAASRRVRALIDPPCNSVHSIATSGIVVGAAATVVALGAIQVHHLARLAAHVCGF